MPTRRDIIFKLMSATAASAAVLTAGCAAVALVTDINVLMREGEELYRAKRYDEAITKFKIVVAREPTNLMGWLWLCRTYIVRAMWGDAIDSGRRAFALSPQGADVLPTFLQALFGGGLEALRTATLPIRFNTSPNI